MTETTNLWTAPDGPALEPPTPAKRPRRRWPIVATAAGVTLLLGTVGLIVSLTNSDDSSPTKVWHQPSADVGTSNDNARFLKKFAAEHIGTLIHANSLMDDATDDVEAGDIEEGASIAHDVSDLYAEMRDGAKDLDGTDSEAGRKTIETMDTCSEAMDESADALSPFDSEAIDAAQVKLTDCTDKLRDLRSLAVDLGVEF